MSIRNGLAAFAGVVGAVVGFTASTAGAHDGVDSLRFNHLKCYKIKDTSTLPGGNLVDLVPHQKAEGFIDENCEVKPTKKLKAAKLCIDVNKNDEGPITDTPLGDVPNAWDYLCYKIKCEQKVPEDLNKNGIHVVDQFDSRVVHVKKAFELCVPLTAKGPDTTTSSTVQTTTTTVDTTSTTVQTTTTTVDTTSSTVQTTTTTVDTTSTTAQTTTTTIKLPALDHYKLYLATGPDGPTVTLVDQFDAFDGVVEKPNLGNVVWFMPPAEKIHDNQAFPINDPKTHLTCYGIPDQNAPTRTVLLSNQFNPLDGSLQTTQTGRPVALCVPSGKSLDPTNDPTPQDPGLRDHFKCYDAQGHNPKASITLIDQFETQSTAVLELLYLCNPVDKNGEGIMSPKEHLACYRIEPTTQNQKVIVGNQFGSPQTVIPSEAQALCVPTDKIFPVDCGLLPPDNNGVCLGFCPTGTKCTLVDSKGLTCGCQ